MAEVRWRGGIVLERSLHLAGGTVVLRQRFAGSDTRVIVTHDAALRARVEVHSGQLSFPQVSSELLAPSRFVLAVPPRSVLRMRFADADVTSEGIGAVRALDAHTMPAIEAESGCGRVLASLDPDAGVASTLVRARGHLHDSVAALAPVRVAAARVGVAEETLSRRFAAAYGISPKQYCHRARLFDAAILLFEGTSIVEAALRAGFNDLTRFYAQFRRLLGDTPGHYARIRKRQDAVAPRR
ncbi:MAG TPA: helix-turn-helix domain-containing protein [Kofleriaceae bacterium]